MEGKAHIKRVVLAHLVLKLLANPVPNLGSCFLVQPASSLNFLADPTVLALLREDPTKASIVRGPPEGEVEEEKDLTNSAWKGEKQDKLQAEETNVEQVKVALRIPRVQ